MFRPHCIVLSLLAVLAFGVPAAAAERSAPEVDRFAQVLLSELSTPPDRPFEVFLPVHALAAPPAPPLEVSRPWYPDPHGYDISWPQCGGRYPEGPKGYAIIGITDGNAFEMNPCLDEQWAWAARDGVAGYVNVHSLRNESLNRWGTSGHYGQCAEGDVHCFERNAGYAQVTWALEEATRRGISAPFVWLDVETLNYWSPDTARNRSLLEGALQAVRDAGMDPGIYTTRLMWEEITGSWNPGVPSWRPVGESSRQVAEEACSTPLAGSLPVMTQWVEGNFDNNVLCPTGVDPRTLFRVP